MSIHGEFKFCIIQIGYTFRGRMVIANYLFIRDVLEYHHYETTNKLRLCIQFAMYTPLL